MVKTLFGNQKKESNNEIVYLVAIGSAAVAICVGAVVLLVLGSLSSLDLGILGTTTISSANNNINYNSAQRSINHDNNNDMTMTPSGNHMAAATTTSIVIPSNSPGSNPTGMAGMLASIQQNDKNQPAWIIAGHWWLESDRPLMMISNSDEDTSDTATTTTLKPHVTNFTALIYAISDIDGTSFHTYKLSNFAQTSITTQKDTNSVTIYGTFTLTSEEGKSINNVHGYITIINNKIELWINTPAHTQDRFDGPTTTITGIVSITMT